MMWLHGYEFKRKGKCSVQVGGKKPSNYGLSYYFLKTLLCTVNYILMTLQLKRVTKQLCMCIYSDLEFDNSCYEWQARGHLLCEESKFYLSINAIKGLP